VSLNEGRRLLLFYLHKLKVQFCFRMKSNWFEVARFLRSGKTSYVIAIALPIENREEPAWLGIRDVRFKVMRFR
jgi:hypothetical protein